MLFRSLVINAEVKPSYTVAVIGDGAVGFAGVIGAKLLGAEKIILLSHHDDRAQLVKNSVQSMLYLVEMNKLVKLLAQVLLLVE